MVSQRKAQFAFRGSRIHALENVTLIRFHATSVKSGSRQGLLGHIGYMMAGNAGLEPATRRLTAACSTN